MTASPPGPVRARWWDPSLWQAPLKVPLLQGVRRKSLPWTAAAKTNHCSSRRGHQAEGRWWCLKAHVETILIYYLSSLQELVKEYVHPSQVRRVFQASKVCQSSPSPGLLTFVCLPGVCLQAARRVLSLKNPGVKAGSPEYSSFNVFLTWKIVLNDTDGIDKYIPQWASKLSWWEAGGKKIFNFQFNPWWWGNWSSYYVFKIFSQAWAKDR